MIGYLPQFPEKQQNADTTADFLTNVTPAERAKDE
jgi:hypothetical protein